jgi:murein L,D-transpeptidase YcbB/YkuD
MIDPRVPLLRERLGVSAAAENPELYDEAVVAAVKEFQAAAGITADGIAGKGTLAIMNKASEDHVATILANMEKWRWVPRHLGTFYVRVNIPDFSLDVYQDDAVVHSTRLVVGKVNNQTPIFSDEMEHIIVNPAWNVPASIALKEMLPTLRRSGGSVRGYEFYAKIRGRFRPVNPRFINWRTVDMDDIQIRQPPGERNALGAIKFMFPNRYAVYLHDTPSKALFAREQRAFSHGCMRVMDPMEFADVILAHEPNGWNAARLKNLIGGPERKVDLPVHIPVHITYFTAWVDEAGSLQVRDDIYGHDGRITAALGLTS